MSKRDRRRSFQQQQEEQPNANQNVTIHDVDQAGYGDIHRKLEKISSDKLRVHNDGTMEFSGFRMLTTGITNFGDDTEKFVRFLLALDTSIQWWLGDLLIYAERVRGETYQEFARRYQFEVSTLYQYRYVAERVKLDDRVAGLSFGHHQVVAGLSPKDQRKYLRMADEESWSIRQLREQLRAAEARKQQLAAQEADLTPGEERIQSVGMYFNRERWQQLPKEERLRAYNSLRSIMQRLEEWGIE
jgi:hypothetical protein